LTAAIVRADAAAATAPVSLCVEVLPLQQSSQRGQVTQWAVSAWTTGGNVPDATVRLQASPAGAGTPHFSFGCGSDDGTSSCNLGAVDAGSARRQLQAQLTVPLTATTVTSASLTAIGGAANLRTAPEASASITVLVPPSPVGVSSSLPGLPPIGVAAPTPTLSPGGNAAGLFPTLDPSSPASAPSSASDGAAPVAHTSSAYTGAASPAGAEVAGLVFLALAFVLALTRVSIRRPVPSSTAAVSPSGTPPEPASRPDDPGEPPAENAES
jgi:hypothetical protein